MQSRCHYNWKYVHTTRVRNHEGSHSTARQHRSQLSISVSIHMNDDLCSESLVIAQTYCINRTFLKYRHSPITVIYMKQDRSFTELVLDNQQYRIKILSVRPSLAVRTFDIF